jgi:choline kinase
MRAVIIGAGRGRRLMPLTDDAPTCDAPVAGREILGSTRFSATSTARACG